MKWFSNVLTKPRSSAVNIVKISLENQQDEEISIYIENVCIFTLFVGL